MSRGGQEGNQNASKANRQQGNDITRFGVQNPEKVRKITEVIFQKAQEGDLKAADMIFDRMHGKAPQAIEHSINTHEQSLDDLE